MAKLSAWLVTLIGVLWAVYMFGLIPDVSPTTGWMGWLVALSFLVMGISKLMRSYSGKR